LRDQSTQNTIFGSVEPGVALLVMGAHASKALSMIESLSIAGVVLMVMGVTVLAALFVCFFARTFGQPLTQYSQGMRFAKRRRELKPASSSAP
jgi:hypothetical protein